MNQLISDEASRPDLFVWNGEITSEGLQAWADAHGVTIPRDLAVLWEVTGGGDFLETETLLNPLGPADDHDSVLCSTIGAWARGLPPSYWVFHSGSWLSVFPSGTGDFLILRPDDLAVRKAVRSVDEWYDELRKELARRYGLR